MRHLIACLVAVAVGAAAAVAVSARRAPALPPGWAEVVVLGRDDAPIEGVTLRWDEHGPPVAETDARGVARIDLAGRGAATSVLLGGALEAWDHYGVAALRSEIRIPTAVPIDVRFVDARTGAALVGGYVGWTEDRSNPVPAARPTEVHRVWIECNSDFYFEVVEAPAGFAVPYDSVRFGPISGVAKRARLEIPAWPSGRLRVRVTDADGHPVVGAIELAADIHWGERWMPATTDADGVATFDAVPLVPDSDLLVAVRRVDRWTRTSVHVVAGTSDYDAAVALPATPSPAEGTCASPRGDPLVGRESELPQGGNSTLRIHVLRRDGSPAPHVEVDIHGRGTDVKLARDVSWQTNVRTDADGRATRDDLAVTGRSDADAQKLRVFVWCPGLAFTAADVALRPGGVADCELREGDGQTIDLTVVDRSGHPMPWVRVRAERKHGFDYEWGLVDGDVQSLAPRTGLDGHLVLRGLPPGETYVLTDFYGREADRSLRAGEPATIRLK